MKMTFDLCFERELYDLCDAAAAQQEARKTGASVYSWKTIGRSNWLERGFSVVDVLGLVVLPGRLGDRVDMPDDEVEEGAG